MPPRFNIPPVTRALLIVLIGETTLSAMIRYSNWNGEKEVTIPYLTLVPSVMLFYPWTLATSTLVESNIFTLAITGFTLYHGGKYLERAWTSAEFAKFVGIVALLPNVLTALLYLGLSIITGSSDWVLTPIAGGIPLQIAFLISFSQLVPAHTVTLFKGIISLRVPRFPLIYMGVILIGVFTILSISALFLAVFSFIVSWTYLRFYKLAYPDLDVSQGPSLRGDASETFAFAEFFPEIVRPPIAAVCDQIFNLLVALRVCTPFSAADISAARGDAYVQRSAPVSTRAETERRRALALKALDQRLHAATVGAAKPPPSTQPQPSGSSVQTQPQVSAQTAMTSQPADVLGETRYDPEQEGEGIKESS